jgi:hypothetical protein
MSRHTIDGGDTPGLSARLSQARAKLGAASTPEIFALQISVPGNLHGQLYAWIVAVRSRAASARYGIKFIVTEDAIGFGFRRHGESPFDYAG